MVTLSNSDGTQASALACGCEESAVLSPKVTTAAAPRPALHLQPFSCSRNMPEPASSHSPSWLDDPQAQKLKTILDSEVTCTRLTRPEVAGLGRRPSVSATLNQKTMKAHNLRWQRRRRFPYRDPFHSLLQVPSLLSFRIVPWRTEIFRRWELGDQGGTAFEVEQKKVL